MERLITYKILLLALCVCLIGCSDAQLLPTEGQPDMDLTIVYPQNETEIAGGQSLRITVVFNDADGNFIEGAEVEATLWSPEGETYTSLPCIDHGNGRYITNHVSLPLRNSQGIWRVSALAITEDGRRQNSEGEFIGYPSYSERLEENFGFWIDLTDLFPYNISNAEDPQLKTYSYDDGGYVILANNLTTTQINNTFIILDIHWRRTDFPPDQSSAAKYVLNLAGPHRVSLDITEPDLLVQEETFLGSQAWHVTGYWKQDNAIGNPQPDAPLDWIIFNCPGSEKVWTILITTNDIEYLDDLKSIRKSFGCSME
jgi:hypothetical protein